MKLNTKNDGNKKDKNTFDLRRDWMILVGLKLYKKGLRLNTFPDKTHYYYCYYNTPLGGLKETKLFLPHPRVKLGIVGSLRDREVACSASDRQGSNFESCVWRTVSSHSSHNPQEVLLAQFSQYVHKGGLKPDSLHFYYNIPASLQLLSLH